MNFDDGRGNGETVDKWGNYVTNDVTLVFANFEESLAAGFARALGFEEFASTQDSVHILGQVVDPVYDRDGVITQFEDPKPYTKSGGDGDNLFILSNEADTILLDDRNADNDEGGRINIIHGFDLAADGFRLRFDGGFLDGNNQGSFVGAGGLRDLLSFAETIEQRGSDLVFTLQSRSAARDPLTLVVTGTALADLPAGPTPLTATRPVTATFDADTGSKTVNLFSQIIDDRGSAGNRDILAGSLDELQGLAGLSVDLETGVLRIDTGAFATFGAGATQTVNLSYTVVDTFGNEAEASAAITVNGGDEPDGIGGVTSVAVVEDGLTTAEGQLLALGAGDGTDPFVAVTDAVGAAGRGAFSLAADGSWVYTLANAAAQELAEGEVVTDSITVSRSNGATAVLTVEITGTDDVPIIAGNLAGEVVEDGASTAAGTVTVVDADAGQSAIRAQAATAGLYGSFAITTTGAWTYILDNDSDAVQALGPEDMPVERFAIATEDGTPAEISVTVRGAAEAPLNRAPISAPDEFRGAEDTQIVGNVLLNDEDPDDDPMTVRVLRDVDAGELTLTPQGAVTYTPEPNANGTVSFTYVATDGITDGAETLVSLVIDPANDAPVAGEPLRLEAVEDGETQTVALRTGATDPDGDPLTVDLEDALPAGLSVLDGRLSVDPGAAIFQSLGVDGSREISVAYTLSDGTAPPVSQTAIVTVLGANDTATIDGDFAGAVGEDDTLTVAGLLTVQDPDAGEAAAEPQTARQGTFVAFSIDAGGAWSYTLDNELPAVQALEAGAERTDTFAVQSVDGSAVGTVAVTVRGRNDAPQITREGSDTDTAQLVETDAGLTVTAALT